MSQPDWKSLEHEYITTNISYAKLAAKYKMSKDTVSKRAQRGKWHGKRTAFRNSLTTDVLQKVKRTRVKDEADNLIKIQRAADKMSDVVEQVFNDDEQFRRHIVQTREGDIWNAEQRTFDKYDTKAIKELTGALKDLAITIRNAYDLPTATEKSAMEIAAERLLLDKEKSGVGDGDEKTTGVIEIPAVVPDDEAPETMAEENVE